MKTLHIIHNYPPEFAGGTEIYLQALVRAQLRQGHDLTIVAGSETRSPEPSLTEERASEPRVLRFRRAENDHYRVDFRPRGFKEYLAGVVRSVSPDIVHLHHWFNLGNDVISFLTGLGRPVVVTLHDLYAGCPRIFMIRPDGFFCGQLLPTPLRRCVECVQPDFGAADPTDEIIARRRMLARELERAARVICPSSSHARMMAKARLLPEEYITILGHGLLGQLTPQPPQRTAGLLRVGTWGHLSRVKGIVELLEAIRLLHGKYAGKLELHLFGRPTPGFEDELERRCVGLPVHRHGAYRGDEVAGFARRIDLAVFPSHAHESYSFVLDEACALRIPVIVSDRGALADRGRKFADTVDPTDPVEIAGAIEKYLLRPDLLEDRRAGMPDQPFTIHDHAQRLEAIYGEVLRHD